MNNKTFKNTILILALLLSSTFIFAQEAIGVRGLYRIGASITYKTFVHQGGAVEAIGTFYKNRAFDVDLTILYELHKSFGSSNGWYYYYGLGGHTGLNARDLSMIGVLGLDFRFSSLPLNLSLDWIPTLLRIRGDNYRFDGGGLAIRYMF